MSKRQIESLPRLLDALSRRKLPLTSYAEWDYEKIMKKHDPKELKEITDEIDSIFRCHRDVLNDEPRIANPLREAGKAAQTKYKDLAHEKPKAT